MAEGVFLILIAFCGTSCAFVLQKSAGPFRLRGVGRRPKGPAYELRLHIRIVLSRLPETTMGVPFLRRPVASPVMIPV